MVQNPPVNPNSDSVYPMVTCFRVRTNRPTKRLNLHVFSISPLPKSYRDAFIDANWQNAMRDEYHVLIKDKTWTLVPRPPDTNIVCCMWLFRHKYLTYGTLSRYKARLVANGSTQLEGVDVDETFSRVVKQGTIRTVLSLAASRHWPIHQLCGKLEGGQDDGRDSITGFKGQATDATFNAPMGDEPLCLDMSSIGKGQVQINCQSIGRYWTAYATGNWQACHYAVSYRPPKCQLHSFVVSCLDEAMRVREEMNYNGLKARIAKEVEANQKRIKKELKKQHVLKRKVEAINNLSEYVAQLRRISKGHAYTISSEPLGMNVPTPSAKAVSTYGFMYSGGRSVGDTIYKYMPYACRFSPEYVHDCLSISSEDKELAITDRVAASIAAPAAEKIILGYQKFHHRLINQSHSIKMKLHESLHGPSLTGSDWASSISIFFCLGTQKHIGTEAHQNSTQVDSERSQRAAVEK
ncbi:ribonuclease H-like domain-containing protein [Tanacetum coccineum]